MNNLSEHDIQNSIRIELSKLGFCTERINVGSGFLVSKELMNKIKACCPQLRGELDKVRYFSTGAVKGRSDLSAIKDGRVYFLEVKDAIGKASKEQVDFIKTMRSRYGCVAGVVRSVKEALALVSPDFWEIDGDGYLHCPYCGNVCTSSVEYNTQDFNCCPKCGKPVNFY